MMNVGTFILVCIQYDVHVSFIRFKVMNGENWLSGCEKKQGYAVFTLLFQADSVLKVGRSSFR